MDMSHFLLSLILPLSAFTLPRPAFHVRRFPWLFLFFICLSGCTHRLDRSDIEQLKYLLVSLEQGGGGVPISPHLVLTTAHLIWKPPGKTEQTLYIYMPPDFTHHTVKGQVVFIRREKDLCLIKTDYTFSNYARLAKKVNFFEDVILVSNFLSADVSLFADRDYYGYSPSIQIGQFIDEKTVRGTRLLQFNGGTVFGDSGSPLFNKKKELVGIVSRVGLSQPGYGRSASVVTHYGLAIHLEEIRQFLKEGRL
jgi:hypothetical protein